MATETAPPATVTPPAKPVARRGLLSRALRWILRLIYGGKRALLTVPFTLGALYLGWLMTVYWWNYNYSTGIRTGVINKVSFKGRPLCKYVAADMPLIGAPGQVNTNAETFTFTIDDERENAPLLLQLQTAEKSQKPVTVHYRQDLKMLPWRWCVETQYHATKIEP